MVNRKRSHVFQAEAPDSGRARGGRNAAESDSAAARRHVRRRDAKRNVDGERGRASARPAEDVRMAAGGVATQGREDVGGAPAESGPTQAQDRDPATQAEQYIRQGCRYVFFYGCCGLLGGVPVAVVDGPRFPAF